LNEGPPLSFVEAAAFLFSMAAFYGIEAAPIP